MSTPVFIQAGYAFRQNARIPQGLDADAIGKELERLAGERGDARYAAVVEQARSPESAMHAYFEWDNTAAAEAHRIDSARYLVRSIVPIVVNPQTEDEYTAQTRVFVSRYVETGNSREDAGIFERRPVMRAPMRLVVRTSEQTPDEYGVVISKPLERANTEKRTGALATLRKWADAYGRDPYFAGVVAAIRALDG